MASKASCEKSKSRARTGLGLACGGGRGIRCGGAGRSIEGSDGAGGRDSPPEEERGRECIPRVFPAAEKRGARERRERRAAE